MKKLFICLALLFPLLLSAQTLKGTYVKSVEPGDTTLEKISFTGNNFKMFETDRESKVTYGSISGTYKMDTYQVEYSTTTVLTMHYDDGRSDSTFNFFVATIGDGFSLTNLLGAEGLMNICMATMMNVTSTVSFNKEGTFTDNSRIQPKKKSSHSNTSYSTPVYPAPVPSYNGYNSGSGSGGGYSVPKATWKVCPVCYGSTVCKVCGGSGIYSNYGFSDTCSACHGNGKCWQCGGKGGYER